MTKRFWINVGKYGLGIVVLAYAIWSNWAPANGPGLSTILRQPICWWALTLAATMACVSLALSFVRWYILVRGQNLPFTLTNATRLGLVGYFFNICLPGSIGGDIIKATSIAREQSRRTVAVATVILDRGIGLWALIWLVAILGSIFWLMGNPELQANLLLQSIVWTSLGLVALTSVMWGALKLLPEWRGERFAGRLSRIPKVGASAAEFWRALWIYRSKSEVIFGSLALSLVVHVGNVLTFYFAVQTFENTDGGKIPTLAEHFLIVPIGMVVQALFPTPGGVGGGEFGFGKLYHMIGSTEATGVSGSVAQRFLSYVLGLTGYLVYLRMKPTLQASTETKVLTEKPYPEPVVREVVPVSEG